MRSQQDGCVQRVRRLLQQVGWVLECVRALAAVTCAARAPHPLLPPNAVVSLGRKGRAES